ncbi:MAG TPA: hypothetical protein VHT00_10950 [Stellaceae bacterium]|nr:hypothetical protein [Stellaceae bacterium]
MKSATGTAAASTREDRALRFVRLELAPSRERWIATLGFTGLAMIGVIATVTFRIPYPVLVFAGILLLTVPATHRPFRQAVEATGAAVVGAGFAILLAVTTYDQPWFYLPLQCAALTVLLLLSRLTSARAGFILAALVLSFAEPAYLPDPETAIRAALFNGLALAGTAWVVAAARAPFAPLATREEAPAPPGRAELVRFALLVLTAIGLQMLLYNTINLPEIRTGVIAVLLTADPGSAGGLAEDAVASALRNKLRRARLADDRRGRPVDGRSRLFCGARGMLLFCGGLGRAWQPTYFLCLRAGRGHGDAGAVAGRPIYDRHCPQPVECRRSFVGVFGYRADCAAAGFVGGTAALACGRSGGEGQRGGAVEDGGTSVDLDGERARIVPLSGEKVDKIGDATAIAGQRAVISGFRRGDEGNGELMLREGRLKVGIRGPNLSLARELQRVEIGSRLISSRFGFAHPGCPE